MTAETDLQESYKALIESHNFFELKRLLDLTHAIPDEATVRAAYPVYLKSDHSDKVKFFYVLKLSEITRIIPDDATAMEICQLSLKFDTIQLLEMIAKRFQISASRFAEMSENVQKKYSEWVNGGRFNDIAQLLEITAVKPDETVIQQGYRHYLQEGKIISFVGLKKRSGVVPDQAMLLEIIKHYEHQAAIQGQVSTDGNVWRDRLEKLHHIIDEQSSASTQQTSADTQPKVDA